MKIIAVIGSLRDGNTKFLVDSMVDDIEHDVKVNIQKIHLKNIKMGFCNGCLSCDNTGKCNIDDDMSQIVGEIRNADGFIFATPARWGLLSGEIKTFFDRLNPLAVKEELAGKACVNVVVGQSEESDKESIDLAARSLKIFCENSGIEVVDTTLVCGCYGSKDAESKSAYIELCLQAGRKLVNNLKERNRDGYKI